MSIRVSLLTIESDSADPALMAALRDLLERAGVSSIVIAAPAPPPAAPATNGGTIAESLMHGSLQEQVMDEVTRQPAITVEGLAGAILNDTSKDGVRRVRLAVDPLVAVGRLERSGSGKLYTPAYAATLPAFQRPETKRPKAKPEAPAPVVAAPAVEREPCGSFPPCRNCREGGGGCLSIVKRATPLEREARASTRLDGETVAIEAPVQEIETVDAEPPSALRGAAVPPSLAGLTTRAIELIESRPGLRVKELATELLGSAKQGDLIRMGRLLTPLALSGRIRRHGEPGNIKHYPASGATASGSPAREASPALRMTEEQLVNRMPDFGRVQGTVAPAITPGSDAERLVAAVHANPGTSVHELAQALLGRVDGTAIRRIDMLVGPLTMSGKICRFNGRLYRDTKQAAEMRLPPPGSPSGNRRPGAGAAPLQRVQDTKDMFDRIVASFTEDHATPVADLARELFGSSTGGTVEKVQLALRQLCASKRLRSLGGGGYRPISETERDTAGEDSDDDLDEDETDDDVELESNGAPDDDALEELELS